MSRGVEANTVSGVQDLFLDHARRERLTVGVHLMDGRELVARVKGFDRFAVLVEDADGDWLLFKHAIATIRPAGVRPSPVSAASEP